MKRIVCLLAILMFCVPLISMQALRIRKWEVDGTVLIQMVEEIKGTYSDFCLQKKSEEKNKAVYSGYKLVFNEGQEGREWKFEGDEAKDMWHQLDMLYELQLMKKQELLS